MNPDETPFDHPAISGGYPLDADEKARVDRVAAGPCVDCDQAIRNCTCDDVLRCSCGIPDEVCVCAGKTGRK